MAVKTEVRKILPRVLGLKVRSRHSVYGFAMDQEFSLSHNSPGTQELLSMSMEVSLGGESFTLIVKRVGKPGGSKDNGGEPGLFILFGDRARSVSLPSFKQALEALASQPVRA